MKHYILNGTWGSGGGRPPLRTILQVSGWRQTSMYHIGPITILADFHPRSTDSPVNQSRAPPMSPSIWCITEIQPAVAEPFSLCLQANAEALLWTSYLSYVPWGCDRAASVDRLGLWGLAGTPGTGRLLPTDAGQAELAGMLGLS